MNDQGIESRPSLRGEDLRDRAVIGCIRAQAVNGLSRECDESSGAQQSRRVVYDRLVSGADCRFGSDAHRAIL